VVQSLKVRNWQETFETGKSVAHIRHTPTPLINAKHGSDPSYPRPMVSGAADSLRRFFASAGLSGQAESVISDLARELELLSFKPGDVLIEEREADDSLYIILEGRAGVMARGKALADLGRGETVGELALLTGATVNRQVGGSISPASAMTGKHFCGLLCRHTVLFAP
jgi:hypothetical protein